MLSRERVTFNAAEATGLLLPAHRSKGGPTEALQQPRRRGDRRGNGYIGRRPEVVHSALRAELVAPGAIGMHDAVSLIIAEFRRLEANGTLAPRTAFAYTSIAKEFAASCTDDGAVVLADVATEMVYAYVESTVAPGTRRPGLPAKYWTRMRRRSGVRAMFDTARSLGLTNVNPAATVVVAEDDTTVAPVYRPLTEVEATRCRHASAYNPNDARLPAVCALSLAGAGTDEIHRILFEHVDSAAARVWCAGSGRKYSRWLRLDAWAVEAIAAHALSLGRRGVQADQLPTTAVVAVPPSRRRRSTRMADVELSPQSMMVGLVRRVLRVAVLLDSPGVRPSSLVEYAAVREYRRTGSLESAAVLIGVADLNAVADVIGYNWRRENCIAPDWEQRS